MTLTKSDPSPPHLIHVGNVPIALASAAVAYGKRHKIPVVIDIRDLWPDIYVDLIPERFISLRQPVLSALHATSFALKKSLRDAAAITALTPSYLDWALGLAGRPVKPADRIFEMCYPVRQHQQSAADIANLRGHLRLDPGHTIACYAGNIGYQSDFKTLITAARKLQSTAPTFRLVLAGSGPMTEELKNLSADLDNVIIPGWLKGSELSALMSIASIGMIAYKPVPNFLRNIPNKFSEYLGNGLAVACGLGGEMGRLVQETSCGFIYEPGNADMLVNELAQLINDPARLSNMGAKARDLHRTRFDGAQIYPKFADYLEDLAKTHINPEHAA